jgi:hypothetical protein
VRAHGPTASSRGKRAVRGSGGLDGLRPSRGGGQSPPLKDGTMSFAVEEAAP